MLKNGAVELGTKIKRVIDNTTLRMEIIVWIP